MGKKYVLGFITLIIILSSTIIAFNYRVDYLQFYHKAIGYDPMFSYEQRYQAPGIAKNYDYSSIILGSSMTENTKASYVGKIMGGDWIRLSISGGSAHEQTLLLNLGLKTHNVENVLWCIEYSSMIGKSNRVTEQEGAFPGYFYDYNPFNDVKYLLNYNTIEKNISALKNKNVQSTEEIIDGINSWDWFSNYGEEHAVASYKSYKESINTFPFEKYEWDNIKNNIDKNIIPTIKNNPNTHFYLYYPPYSILRYRFFYEYSNDLFYNELEMKKYIFEKLQGYKNVSIYDFQYEEKINTDLDLYKDMSHHNGQINNYIVEKIYDNEYLVTKDNLLENNNKLKLQVESYNKH